MQNPQRTPSRSTTSGGQDAEEPVQVSVMSQGPLAGRQMVSPVWNRSVGQDGPEPVQFSATSQTLRAGRQTVELER
jgi:hypothetical protein